MFLLGSSQIQIMQRSQILIMQRYRLNYPNKHSKYDVHYAMFCNLKVQFFCCLFMIYHFNCWTMISHVPVEFFSTLYCFVNIVKLQPSSNHSFTCAILWLRSSTCASLVDLQLSCACGFRALLLPRVSHRILALHCIPSHCSTALVSRRVTTYRSNV